MSHDVSRLRSPSEAGYLAWLAHRVSAIALVPLLGLHTAVALYPQYGFSTVYQWGWYGGLLDLTLGLVLLHGVLGVRATVADTRFGDRTKSLLTGLVGVLALGLFLYRLIG